MRQFPAHSNAALSLFFFIAGFIASSSCLGAVPESGHLIDFSATPDGNFQGYSELGATFFAIDGVLTSTELGDTPAMSRGIIGHDGDSRVRAVTVFFDPPVVQVSVELGDFGTDADLLLLEAFNHEGVMIDRQTKAISQADYSMHTLIVEGLAIHQVKFGSEGQYPNSVYADNFCFVQIPEPTSLLLVAISGLLCCSLRCRT